MLTLAIGGVQLLRGHLHSHGPQVCLKAFIYPPFLLTNVRPPSSSCTVVSLYQNDFIPQLTRRRSCHSICRPVTTSRIASSKRGVKKRAYRYCSTKLKGFPFNYIVRIKINIFNTKTEKKKKKKKKKKKRYTRMEHVSFTHMHRGFNVHW